jgi:hypothetical protein
VSKPRPTPKLPSNAATLAHWFIFCCTEEERPRGMGKKTDIGSAGGMESKAALSLAQVKFL